MYVNKAYIFSSAISLNGGVSDEVYFLADSDKFEKQAFLKLCDMTVEYTFATDSGLDDSYKTLYRENGIKILTGNPNINI